MERWEEARGRHRSTPADLEPLNLGQTPEIRENAGGCGHIWKQAKGVTDGQWRPSTCPACRKDDAEKAQAERAAYTGDILEDLVMAGVNVRKYGHATLDSFDTSADPQALQAARAYIEAWRRSRRTRFGPRDWLYLYGAGSTRRGRDVTIGKLGNGKTHLAIAIGRRLIEAGWLDPARFLFRTAEAILIESEATFRANSDDSEKNLLAFYQRPDLLIVDDFGVRADPSPHAVRLFDELTKRREAHGTIWTSNLSPRVVAEAGDSLRRIVDRIVGECGGIGGRYMVEFHGDSRRTRRTAA